MRNWSDVKKRELAELLEEWPSELYEATSWYYTPSKTVRAGIVSGMVRLCSFGILDRRWDPFWAELGRFGRWQWTTGVGVERLAGMVSCRYGMRGAYEWGARRWEDLSILFYLEALRNYRAARAALDQKVSKSEFGPGGRGLLKTGRVWFGDVLRRGVELVGWANSRSATPRAPKLEIGLLFPVPGRSPCFGIWTRNALGCRLYPTGLAEESASRICAGWGVWPVGRLSGVAGYGLPELSASTVLGDFGGGGIGDGRVASGGPVAVVGYGMPLVDQRVGEALRARWTSPGNWFSRLLGAYVTH